MGWEALKVVSSLKTFSFWNLKITYDSGFSNISETNIDKKVYIQTSCILNFALVLLFPIYNNYHRA